MIKDIDDLIRKVSNAAKELGCNGETKRISDKKSIITHNKENVEIRIEYSNEKKSELIIEGTNDEVIKAKCKMSNILTGLSSRLVEYNNSARYEIDLPK